MNIDPVENCNHLECIRCGRCKNACPVDTISCGIKNREELIKKVIKNAIAYITRKKK